LSGERRPPSGRNPADITFIAGNRRRHSAAARGLRQMLPALAEWRCR
jgi:hypothetical protein